MGGAHPINAHSQGTGGRVSGKTTRAFFIMIKLKCRHCWKLVKPKIATNGPHVEARCPICDNWIKFLNRKERKIVMRLMIRKIKTGR